VHLCVSVFESFDFDALKRHYKFLLHQDLALNLAINSLFMASQLPMASPMTKWRTQVPLSNETFAMIKVLSSFPVDKGRYLVQTSSFLASPCQTLIGFEHLESFERVRQRKAPTCEAIVLLIALLWLHFPLPTCSELWIGFALSIPTPFFEFVEGVADNCRSSITNIELLAWAPKLVRDMRICYNGPPLPRNSGPLAVSRSA
jgi:hypothetical protein